ncbi:Heavy metal-associated isoprenylated plant protein 35 [Camellia lanceoleosa]|uniref:Heavy metal-associated isoprenylated plant protein 35 n=1 Tax=Camellia lanceoleosa TaxID=1840588 RepID=A0ACC0IHH7_9ERIC|nr:Heavy metal-associated isoprenylated plant protein 35 [Camellia lanceoleosa]
MATTPGQGESLDPLTYKTSVLKVSVHCEGCKRKVKKVLLGVHGVNAVDVDIKQQKVIVNGNVDAATLIKKLEKSGKHAQLWPEIVAEKKEKKLHKSKNKEKPIDPETNTQASDDHGSPKKEKPTVKVEASKSGASPAKNSEGGGGGAVKFEDGAAKHGGRGGSEVAESKSEGKKPETGSAGKQLPVTDKKGGDSEGGDKESDGDSDNSGKKMKNEEQKSTAKDKPSSGGGPASTRLENQHVGPPPPVSFIPPRHHHHGYQYPPQYYAPSSSGGAPDHYVGRPPVNLSPPRHDGYQYAVSYNTSYPTSSYTTSYYASPPPQSYAYVHPGPETEPPPSDLDSYPRQPLDSFEMFSDENPNGCFIM